ncbi:thiamine pyrophosphokinase 1 [Lamellibrachia satsuma]|nr:thiamine pyrophosphokinase 1 [Lamellibrachia satsuma]
MTVTLAFQSVTCSYYVHWSLDRSKARARPFPMGRHGSGGEVSTNPVHVHADQHENKHLIQVTTMWRPFAPFNARSGVSTALMILNTPFCRNVDPLKCLWKKALLKVAVDGALDHLHSCKHLPLATHQLDLITGDFDSVQPKLLQYYKDQGCEVIETPDQDYTDFTKCLTIVIERIKTHQLKVDSIVAYGDMNGRFDHVMGNIDTLFRGCRETDVPIYLIGSEAITFLLTKGSHQIDVNSPSRGAYCGLIPIGQSCNHVTTTGFKWNLSDQALAFGQLVSTSNSFTDSPVVTVDTDNPIVLTMDLAFNHCHSEEH